MKKMSLFIVLSLLFMSAHANAALLRLTPSDNVVEQGSSFYVDVEIVDLDPDILSSFDIDVFYDSTLVSATSVSFFDKLDDALGFFPSLQSSDISVAAVTNAAETSFLTDAELALQQSGLGVFSLFRVNFLANNIGVTPLTLGVTFLTGEFDPTPTNPFNLKDVSFSTEVSSVAVIARAVPEPASLLLVVLGLFGCLVTRARLFAAR